MAGAEIGRAMFTGDLDEAKRKEMMDQIKRDTDATDAQIKELPGEDGYAAFEKYEKTTGERMAVGQFKDQLTGSDTPLTGEQEQQHIAVMGQEHTDFKWTTDYQNKKPGSADYNQMFTEERIETYEREKAEFDKQVLAKAGHQNSDSRSTQGFRKFPGLPTADANGGNEDGRINVCAEEITGRALQHITF